MWRRVFSIVEFLKHECCRRLLIGFVQCPPVHIREQPETESVVVVVWRVGEAVNNDTVVLGVIDFSHTAVEFVIGD